jgi:hypothetical protein
MRENKFKSVLEMYFVIRMQRRVRRGIRKRLFDRQTKAALILTSALKTYTRKMRVNLRKHSCNTVVSFLISMKQRNKVFSSVHNIYISAKRIQAWYRRMRQRRQSILRGLEMQWQLAEKDIEHVYDTTIGKPKGRRKMPSYPTAPDKLRRSNCRALYNEYKAAYDKKIMKYIFQQQYDSKVSFLKSKLYAPLLSGEISINEGNSNSASSSTSTSSELDVAAGHHQSGSSQQTSRSSHSKGGFHASTINQSAVSSRDVSTVKPKQADILDMLSKQIAQKTQPCIQRVIRLGTLYECICNALNQNISVTTKTAADLKKMIMKMVPVAPTIASEHIVV